MFTPKQGHSQSFVQMMEYADGQMAIGDYYDAQRWYEKAMEIDSNSVEVLWKYAEALRLHKNYEKAEYYYAKVYAKEGGKIYKRSIFWLATMQKNNGKYREALESWKQTKKVYKRDLDSYEFEKARQEIKSCLWARKAVRDTSDHLLYALELPVNTENTELAPVLRDGKFYFTSMRADSVGSNELVNPHLAEVKKEEDIEYSIQIYEADREDTVFSNVSLFKSVQEKGFNSANGSFSPDGKRFYFSRCRDYSCKIYVGKVEGDKLVEIDSLGEIINEYGKVSTMPHSTMVGDREVLFFCSTMPHNYGGLDIWYSFVSNGNQYSLPKSLGSTINSLDNEVSPFYDPKSKRLYFSSSWHKGFGGQDIFYSEVGEENGELTFGEPVNLGIPFNSAQNDTYLIVDPESGRYYFSSNRIGVKSTKNPTCCNDIFSAHIPIKPPPNRFETLADLNKKLPVVLYFHNDRPNPRTKDTTTSLNYMTTYQRYQRMQDEYKKEYSKGLKGDKAEDAKLDIEDFFVQYVEQGVKDLEEFTRLLIVELEKGYDIEITIKGFASPLAETDYNVKLTKRRISSLKNYLLEYEGGRFEPYMEKFAPNGGRLTFNSIPYGEYTAADKIISDNPNDQQNSVYSRKAGLERKIEIQSVSFVYSDSSYAKMKFESQQHDFGYVSSGEVLEKEFKFTNTGEEDLEIGRITADCSCVHASASKNIIKAGESAKIKVTYDTAGKTGLQITHIKIESNVSGGFKEISVSAHLK
jgi:tetratricopeptide (TPR) repeat protein